MISFQASHWSILPPSLPPPNLTSLTSLTSTTSIDSLTSLTSLTILSSLSSLTSLTFHNCLPSLTLLSFMKKNMRIAVCKKIYKNKYYKKKKVT